MAEETGISWCDSTFNGWIGCDPISPGCENCYAKSSTPARTLGIAWGPNEPRRRTGTANWNLPRRWNAAHAKFAAKNGRRRRVFCASLSDVFDNKVDPEWREELWALIRATPNLDWLVLTKRIGNVGAMLPADWGCGYANVWLGISVVNQIEADRDIPKLLRTPAATRFLSMEPLLAQVDLCEHFGMWWNSTMQSYEGTGSMINSKGCEGHYKPGIDLVIVGGESGHNARPMHPDWVRRLRDQCQAANVPFTFKQWGEWRPMRLDEVPKIKGMKCHLVSIDSRRTMASGSFHMAHQIKAMVSDPVYSWQHPVLKLGKKATGRLLDGREWDEMPLDTEAATLKSIGETCS